MESIITKTCNLCKKEKELDDFYVSFVKSKNKNVRDSVCKFCRQCLSDEFYYKKGKRRRRERYKRDSTPSLEYSRQYRLENPEKFLFISAKTRSKRRGVEFSIYETDVVIPEKCPYLGINIVIGNTKQLENSPALDRIDPTKGYVSGNIQVIFTLANRMKNNATEEQLITFAKSILKIHCKD